MAHSSFCLLSSAPGTKQVLALYHCFCLGDSILRALQEENTENMCEHCQHKKGPRSSEDMHMCTRRFMMLSWQDILLILQGSRLTAVFDPQACQQGW